MPPIRPGLPPIFTNANVVWQALYNCRVMDNGGSEVEVKLDYTTGGCRRWRRAARHQSTIVPIPRPVSAGMPRMRWPAVSQPYEG
jgi:hypothetical protein